MMPPSIDSTIASIRNCDKIVRRFAPMALRRPISRVRSVTLTSMMFMMPMPPTSSEIAADGAQEDCQHAVPATERAEQLGLALMMVKSSCVVFFQPMALAQCARA